MIALLLDSEGVICTDDFELRPVGRLVSADTHPRCGKAIVTVWDGQTLAGCCDLLADHQSAHDSRTWTPARELATAI